VAPCATFKRDSLAQYDGTAWLALEDTTGKPGQSSSWRM